jgi:hypothetical protein
MREKENGKEKNQHFQSANVLVQDPLPTAVPVSAVLEWPTEADGERAGVRPRRLAAIHVP